MRRLRRRARVRVRRASNFPSPTIHDSSPRPLKPSPRSSGEEFDEGAVLNAALGSYVHLHFASNTEIPRRLVETCLRWPDAAER
jgi:hypothetical protein